MIIKFKTPRTYLGRNGVGWCTGLCIDIYKEYTIIFPISSKKSIARCNITVDNESISELTVALQEDPLNKILEALDKKTLTTLIGIHPHIDTLLHKKFSEQKEEKL